MTLVGPSLNSNQPRWYVGIRRIYDFWFYRLRRWIPRLVWIGDEIDVCVTFKEDKLNQENPLGGFMSGGIYDIQSRLSNMGITFDTSCGLDGRDWEWDWSLSGPISIQFRGRAKRPDKRVRNENPKLRLVKE